MMLGGCYNMTETLLCPRVSCLQVLRMAMQGWYKSIAHLACSSAHLHLDAKQRNSQCSGSSASRHFAARHQLPFCSAQGTRHIFKANASGSVMYASVWTHAWRNWLSPGVAIQRCGGWP